MLKVGDGLTEYGRRMRATPFTILTVYNQDKILIEEDHCVPHDINSVFQNWTVVAGTPAVGARKFVLTYRPILKNWSESGKSATTKITYTFFFRNKFVAL